MSEQNIFHLEGLSKSYDLKPILKDVNLVFHAGAKIGVIGANGAGKSTLLRVISGEEKEYEGKAWAEDGTTIGFVAQEPHLEEGLTVRENVEIAVAPLRALLERQEELGLQLGEELSPDEMERVMAEFDKVQTEIDARDAYEIDRHVEVAMSKLHLPPEDAFVGECSGGEKRRVALCKVLLEHPDLLLLDEPTNHLDVESVSWLEQTLADYKGTVIIITHDRFFLDRVVGWMLELFHSRAIPYKGNYSDFLEAKATRMRQAESQEKARGKLLERELA